MLLALCTPTASVRYSVVPLAQRGSQTTKEHNSISIKLYLKSRCLRTLCIQVMPGDLVSEKGTMKTNYPYHSGVSQGENKVTKVQTQM